MSARYVPVGWNTSKAVYDAIALATIAIYIFLFLHIAPSFVDTTQPWDGTSLKMRAYGSCAFLLLSVLLSIGPLARLDRRFLPLLYNRRHLGVITCAVALMHASAVLGWYFSYGPGDAYVLLLSANTSYGRIAGFPFEIFGLAALLVLIALAATSHDFWLSFLTPPVWKALHMAVYGAYFAVVLHVALGALQASTNPFLGMVVLACASGVAGLHVAAGRRARAADAAVARPLPQAPWVMAGEIADIVEDRAITVHLADAEPVAIFRHAGKLSAVSNLCAHQNGPLGEGKIIDGCITCPWHGFQYHPEDGCAPAPFTEKLATFNLRVADGKIWLDPRPNPPGTRVEPVVA